MRHHGLAFETEAPPAPRVGSSLMDRRLVLPASHQSCFLPVTCSESVQEEHVLQDRRRIPSLHAHRQRLVKRETFGRLTSLSVPSYSTNK